MSDALKQTILRYTAGLHAKGGVTHTPVDGLHLLRRPNPSHVEYTVEQPLICLVLQGSKQVTIGNHTASYSAGDTMIVTGNLPMATRIRKASVDTPYVALALELNTAVVTDLVSKSFDDHRSPGKVDTDRDLKDALHRLLRLFDRPASLLALEAGLIREIHHWLLVGRHGSMVRELGQPDSRTRRIARAVAVLRAEYRQRIGIERLVAASGMSRSALHLHFREITSLTPLQFQKQLRLMEARHHILFEGRSLSEAGFTVGYESASQFSREYARMYGHPPMTDKRTASNRGKNVRSEPKRAE